LLPVVGRLTTRSARARHGPSPPGTTAGGGPRPCDAPMDRLSAGGGAVSMAASSDRSRIRPKYDPVGRGGDHPVRHGRRAGESHLVRPDPAAGLPQGPLGRRLGGVAPDTRTSGRGAGREVAKGAAAPSHLVSHIQGTCLQSAVASILGEWPSSGAPSPMARAACARMALPRAPRAVGHDRPRVAGRRGHRPHTRDRPGRRVCLASSGKDTSTP
jgi:hypothetical protein